MPDKNSVLELEIYGNLKKLMNERLKYLAEIRSDDDYLSNFYSAATAELPQFNKTVPSCYRILCHHVLKWKK